MARTPIAGTTHHVVINGVGYMLEHPRAYTQRDINAFAPRMASGDPTYSDLRLHQVLTQTDWSHGFRGGRWVDEQAFSRSLNGGIATWYAGKLRLFSQPKEDAGINTYKVHAWVEYDGDLYALCDDRVRQYNGTAWADDKTGLTSPPKWGLDNGLYFFVATDGGNIWRRDSAGVWTDMTIQGKHVCLAGKYMWRSNGSVIYYTDQSDGTLWTNSLQVGVGDVPITSLANFNNSLYIGKADGLWVLDSADPANTPTQVLDTADRYSVWNFLDMATYQDALYFPLGGRIYRYTGANVIDATPYPEGERDMDTEYEFGYFRSLVVRGQFLYGIARDSRSSTTWQDHILLYDGAHWHKLFTSSIVTAPLWSVGWSPSYQRLYCSYSVVGALNGRYWRYNAQGELPYDDYQTYAAALYQIEMNPWDAGMPVIDKSIFSVFLDVVNGVSGTRYVKLWYRLDGASAWTELTAATFYDRHQEYTFPVPLTCKRIQFKVGLHTQDTAETPELEALAIKYIMRPTVEWGWQMRIKLEDELFALDGEREELTPAELKSALETARDSVAPVAFTDLYGAARTVYVSTLSFTPSFNQEGKPIGTIAEVVLVEV